jgi:hypothetical protein
VLELVDHVPAVQVLQAVAEIRPRVVGPGSVRSRELSLLCGTRQEINGHSFMLKLPAPAP